jgi:PAS domain S-box-containing protein
MGLSRFEPENGTFRNHDVSDGLQANEFNSNASYTCYHGTLYFGGINGITWLIPTFIRDSPTPPSVVIKGLRSGNTYIRPPFHPEHLTKEITVADTVRLFNDDRVFSFEFVAMDFVAPAKNQYQYRLEGFDDDWQMIGTKREATFTNLSPGDYVFRVRAGNPDGVWNETGTSVHVVIVPAWWQTWWFRSFGIGLFAFALLTVHRVRLRVIERRNAALQAEISQRRLAEKALAAAEQRYRAIFQGAHIGIYQSLPEGQFINVNPALARMHGYSSPEEMLSSVSDIAGQMFVDRTDRDRIVGLLEQHGEVRDFVYRVRRKDGTMMWISETSREVKDENGKFQHYEGFVVDVTEKRRLEEQLAQSHKLESIGRLAGGVAHDFNNMLTVILGYAELAAGSAQGGTKDLIEGIRQAGVRAQHLTNQLLAFARRQVIRPEISSVNELLSGLQSILRRLVGEDVEISFHPQEALWPVKVDRMQFEQVIINLAANARDAMPNGGKIIFETGNVLLDADYVKGHPDASVGSYIVVTISDTGRGMSEDVRSKLFEPFFTTKDVGKGTGLGLAMVHGIVKQNGGHIAVYSEVDKGTTFRIYLPRSDGSEAGEKADDAASRPGGTETILVVDDEDMILQMAIQVLKAAGYWVLKASSPLQALDLLKTHGDAVDLVITDVVMPEMSGKQLADELRKTRPTMKVLYTSGYTENVIVHHGILEPEVSFLQKPYTPSSLTKAVRRVLDMEKR